MFEYMLTSIPVSFKRSYLVMQLRTFQMMKMRSQNIVVLLWIRRHLATRDKPIAFSLNCRTEKVAFWYQDLQYRHLIPAPVDRTFLSAWLYKHPWIICQKNKPNTLMTHEACDSKLRSVVRPSMHP